MQNQLVEAKLANIQSRDAHVNQQAKDEIFSFVHILKSESQ